MNESNLPACAMRVVYLDHRGGMSSEAFEIHKTNLDCVVCSKKNLRVRILQFLGFAS